MRGFYLIALISRMITYRRTTSTFATYMKKFSQLKHRHYESKNANLGG